MDTERIGEPVEEARGGLWTTLAENIQAAPPEPATNLWASLENKLDFAPQTPAGPAG